MNLAGDADSGHRRHPDTVVMQRDSLVPQMKKLSCAMNQRARSSPVRSARCSKPTKYASRGASGENNISNDVGASASLRKP